MDELVIRNMLALIAQHADDGPLDAYGVLFAEDATWEMPGAPIRRGRADIVAAGAQRRAAGATGPGSHTRHAVLTTAVTVAGDQASATSYWQFFTTTDTAPVLASMGKYDDHLVRAGAGWLLRHRRITLG
ncbi:MAG TPA: nuclear transport factor 2 family protein [Pseudonocardiaceae bacterium]|jgi:3-phenylpropionate/cinnamic acid dioxygenase small subunit|nr:nuclear transport factor 2 family protein [Pseudonocardiaceae bacterium]